MADQSWLLNTIAKASAAPLDGTELVRLVNDPGGTPASQQAAISAIRAYIIALANTWTAEQTISSAGLTFSGNISAAAWTTSGIKLKETAATLTDTTSSGTVADARTHVLGGNTIAASAATTFTDYYSAFLSQSVAGTNVTFANRWALGLSGGLKSSGQSLTGSQAQSLIDFATTWNTSGTPTALKVSVTDTASNAASLLGDFRVGANSVASISKGGNILGGKQSGGSASNVAIGIAAERGLFSPSANMISISAGGQAFQFNSAGGSVYGSGGSYGFTANADPATGTADTAIFRDAAGVLAQRNGVNAQTFRWYHTFTDLSNRQNGALRTAAGYVEVAAETAGTGADDIDVLLTPAGAGNVRFGTHAAVGAELITGYITIKDAGGTSRKVAVIS